MRRFNRNVFRMAWQNKGSFLGAVCIIAIGIFIYVAMADTLRNLKDQVDAYYQESAMADVFAEVAGISQAELKRLEEIPGIRQASGKMSADMRLLAEGQEDVVTVHLLSYDPDDVLNKLSLSSLLSKEDQLFLGARMEAIYGYENGESLKLLRDGNSVDFTLSGTCHAPDYIYTIPPGGTMIPDGEIYDIACIAKEKMEELMGRSDSLNELGFSLSPGYSYEEVRYALVEQLQMYGLISLSKRADQASSSMVDGEMKELTAMGTIMPVIFMSISIFMLYVVLKKMIDRDQSLIGTMKAFGMTDRELMTAYLLEGASAGVLGAVIGTVLAIPFGQFMFHIYVDFFNLPDTVYHNYVNNRITGLFIAVITGMLAVFLGVRDILSITPAQAMKSRAPATAECRPIARHPLRGFLIVLAVGFPFSMSAVLFSFDGVANQMFLDQFTKIQVYDFQLSLDRYVSPIRARQAGEALPEVEQAEAVCVLAAELKNQNLTEFVALYGLNRGSELWKIMDMYGTSYEAPEGGVILNQRTAEKLHVKKGDLIEIVCSGMTVGTVWIPVKNVISESLGSGCYISLDSMTSVFQTEAAANTVLLKARHERREEVKETLLETSRVTWLADTEKMTDSYRDMMGSMMVMVNMFAFLSVIAGGILIYNISMINIRERMTEFGTLMILGKTQSEIGKLLLFEQMFYFILGILMGIPGSRGVKLLVEQVVMSDSYTIDMAISPASYVSAFAICLGIALVACAAELRFISKIQLPEILKGRE